MPISFVFWFLMLLWLIALLYLSWPAYGLVGGSVLLWVLLALLGWKTFGFPIQK